MYASEVSGKKVNILPLICVITSNGACPQILDYVVNINAKTPLFFPISI